MNKLDPKNSPTPIASGATPDMIQPGTPDSPEVPGWMDPQYRYQAVQNAQHYGEPSYMWNGEAQPLPPSASDAYSPPVLGENYLEDLSYRNLDNIIAGVTIARTRNEAFAAARRGGREVFKWNGQWFNTRYAEEAPYSPLQRMERQEPEATSLAAPVQGTLAEPQSEPMGVLYDPKQRKKSQRKENRARRQKSRSTNKEDRQTKRTTKKDERAANKKKRQAKRGN